MIRTTFDGLKETLLQGGIAPRHVRRYMVELSDHFDDLKQHALKAGMTAADAEQEALRQLGAPSDLVKAMLARDELKSVAARYPALVFGLAPIVLLAVSVATCVLVMVGVVTALGGHGGRIYIPEWFVPIGDAWLLFINFALPLLLGAALAFFAVRRRTELRWMALGVALVALLGGFYDVSLQWPAYYGGPGELNFGFGLAPPFPKLASNFTHAAVNLLVVGLPMLWFVRRPQAFV